MAARVDQDQCTGCGACMDACPVEAIQMQDGKAHVDASTCVDCGVCVEECPSDAIALTE